MQIINTKQGTVIVMSFVDAEHCGMNFKNLSFEAEISGKDIKTDMPIALLVQFEGGFVITKDAKKETVEKMQEAKKRFDSLITHIEG